MTSTNIVSGQTVSNVVVTSGNEQLVQYGGVAVSTTVQAGGTQVVLSGTVADTVVLAGGFAHVNHGQAQFATVDSGGALYVGNSGVLSNTTIAVGGYELVSAGGFATETAVSGVEQVVAGGTAILCTVEGGGEQIVNAGGATNFTVVSSGSIEQAIGGVASNTEIGSAGELLITGGTAVAAQVLSTGVLYMEFGAASGTVISSGGASLIGSGYSVSGFVLSGGVELAAPGGIASGTVIEGGGLQVAGPGGESLFAVASAGAVIVAFNNNGAALAGTVVSATIMSGSELIISGVTPTGGFDFAAATDTTLVAGGLIDLSGDAYRASATATLNTATDVLSINGVAQDGSLQLAGDYSGDTFVLFSDGLGGTEVAAVATAQTPAAAIETASVTSVTSGQFVSSAVVTSGSQQLVEGGTTYATQIESGGEQIVYAGSASATQVDSGGLMVVSGGAAFYATVADGGAAYIVSSGFASGVLVQSGGFETVSSGGLDVGVVVNNGGVQTVISGGVAYYAALAGGTQNVGYFGFVSGTTIDAGGTLHLTGGVSVGAVVASGGVLNNFGSGFYTTIGLGGVENVSANSVSSFVQSGGVQDVAFSYGRASGAIIGSGGFQFVAGFASGTVISAGGVEQVAANAGRVGFGTEGGTAVGTDVLSGGEQIIEIYPSSASAIVRDTTIATGGIIDLAALAYTSGETATLNPTTDILDVNQGTVIDYELQLAGDYTGEYFTAFSDGAGGTDITVTEGTPCYCRGTSILTDAGEIPVENLRIGDRLITKSGAVRPLVWIGTRSYAGRFAAGNPTIMPVLFRAGSLPGNVPHRDLYVSPLHAMYIDGVLVPAARLTNNDTIVQIESVDQIDYFHLELETHDVIIAEGALSETYIDDDNRFMFHNAAAYFSRYPDAARAPAKYCAPRVEDGEALEDIRRRLNPTATATPTPLHGNIDIARHDCIAGWAMDDSVAPLRLKLTDNGVTLAELTADLHRPDVQATAGGDGIHGFRHVIDGGLDPAIRHTLQIQRATDGQDIPGSPYLLDIATRAAPIAAPLRGRIDNADRTQVQGWAYADGVPVSLQVLDNGIPIGHVLANRHRADLAQANIAEGTCAFAFRFAAPLSPAIRHVIELRRASDGAALDNSPAVVDAATAFDAALESAIHHAVAAADGPDRTRVLNFLRAQADRLIQQTADSTRAARADARNQSRRHATAAPVFRRALVIDHDVPRENHDAGSQAILAHMRALQRLGYEVSFAAAEQFSEPSDTLATAGITHCAAPLYTGVEDVLRRQQGCFDLIYLHRAPIAEVYMALARRWMPAARILYSVADLHHLRLARQAEIEIRPELLAHARRLRLAECTAAWNADAVLTHSPHEATLLRAAVPAANVHVVPWDIARRDTTTPFAKRHGLAFIGNYSHAPNVDAARWLVEAIMPLVWQHDPTIACRLVGPNPPHALAAKNVHILGQVPDLAEIFAQSRLTVAPLRFGAGIKGKVLESLAAGIPCACTPIAAEGLDLPPSLIANDANALATLILHLHRNAAANRTAARAARAALSTEAAVDQALAAAIEQAMRKVA